MAYAAATLFEPVLHPPVVTVTPPPPPPPISVIPPPPPPVVVNVTPTPVTPAPVAVPVTDTAGLPGTLVADTAAPAAAAPAGGSRDVVVVGAAVGLAVLVSLLGSRRGRR